MPKKASEQPTITRQNYAPPSLAIYGGMTKLTASGTGSQSEAAGMADLTKKP